MSNNPLIPQSKLPNLGTTIFTQMSALAQQHQAINLSQGFPDFEGPLFLQERLAYHVAHGANQYAPMTGVQPLREAIADKTADLYGYKPDANSEVTITAACRDSTIFSLPTNFHAPCGFMVSALSMRPALICQRHFISPRLSACCLRDIAAKPMLLNWQKSREIIAAW